MDIMRADGAAFFDPANSALPPQGRWGVRDNRRLAAGFDPKETREMLVKRFDDPEGCTRMTIARQEGCTHYLCSRVERGVRRRVTIGLRRDGLPFTPADSRLLRALQDTAVARLLVVDRHDGAVDRQISPRMRQVLAGLKEGRSEKELAADLRISQHTVHVYVKRIYCHYRVNSRGELLRLWIRD